MKTTVLLISCVPLSAEGRCSWHDATPLAGGVKDFPSPSSLLVQVVVAAGAARLDPDSSVGLVRRGCPAWGGCVAPSAPKCAVLRVRGGGKAFRERRAALQEWKERLWRNARAGHKDEIRNLLKKKVGSLDAADPVHGWTGLHWAAAAGHAEIVQILIQAGASVNARDKHESTPLHWAAATGQQSVLPVLTRGGGNLHMRDKRGRTPIGVAVKHQQEFAAEASARCTIPA